MKPLLYKFFLGILLTFSCLTAEPDDPEKNIQNIGRQENNAISKLADDDISTSTGIFFLSIKDQGSVKESADMILNFNNKKIIEELIKTSYYLHGKSISNREINKFIKVAYVIDSDFTLKTVKKFASLAASSGDVVFISYLADWAYGIKKYDVINNNDWKKITSSLEFSRLVLEGDSIEIFSLLRSYSKHLELTDWNVELDVSIDETINKWNSDLFGTKKILKKIRTKP